MSIRLFSHYPVYIGLRLNESTPSEAAIMSNWYWMDGSPYTWHDWALSEPNDREHCALLGSRMAWENRWCSERRAYMCGVPATRKCEINS